MGFIGWAVVLVVVGIICRALRSVFEAIDWIAYLCVLAVFIFVWITNGFWSGFFAGIIGGIVVSLLFGFGDGTEVRKFGNKYTLTCDKCGYDELEITSHTDYGVMTRCKRCGRECHHILNH